MKRLDIETLAQIEEGGVSLNTDEIKLFLSFTCNPLLLLVIYFALFKYM
jgi:hypothetical protein